MASAKPIGEVKGELLRESEKAIQVKLDSGDQVWIPRSIIPYFKKSPGNQITLHVEDWWLDQNKIDC